MIQEELAIGNIIYDEKEKCDTIVTAEILDGLNAQINKGRYKPVQATDRSIRMLGFKENGKSPTPDIVSFVSPKAKNEFQVDFLYNKTVMNGALLLFGQYPIPFQYLHQIQNYYISLGREPLKVILDNIVPLFQTKGKA